MNINSKKKKRKNNVIKFLRGRGSKSLPLTGFLAEKTEPNYDTANRHVIFFQIKF
jgi:hypothetical protein